MFLGILYRKLCFAVVVVMLETRENYTTMKMCSGAAALVNANAVASVGKSRIRTPPCMDEFQEYLHSYTGERIKSKTVPRNNNQSQQITTTLSNVDEI